MKHLIHLTLFFAANLACHAEPGQKDQIDVSKILIDDRGLISVKYKTISYVIESKLPLMTKTIRIPVYKGVEGEISEDSIYNYMSAKRKGKPGNIPLSSLYFRTEPGKLKEEFFSLINFYKSSFFKDIDEYTPTAIGIESGMWFVWYDCEYSGVPISLRITVGTNDKQSNSMPKNIRQMGISERATELYLSIYVDERSPFYQGKK